MQKLLTERQLQVALGIARGLSTEEIAQELGITVRTVRMHTDNVRLVLGVQHKRQIPHAVHALGLDA